MLYMLDTNVVIDATNNKKIHKADFVALSEYSR